MSVLWFFSWLDLFHCMDGAQLVYPSVRPSVRPSIHPSMDGHLGCLHLVANVDNAAVNTRVQMFVGVPVFVSLRCIHLGQLLGHQLNA